MNPTRNAWTEPTSRFCAEIDNPSYTIKTIPPFEEARRREALAQYFIHTPPPEQLEESEKATFRLRQRELCDLEIDAALRFAFLRRPLRTGPVLDLLAETLDAASVLLKEQGYALEYSVPDETLSFAVEPRILQMTVIDWLRATKAENAVLPLCFEVGYTAHNVHLTLHADCPMQDERAKRLLEMTANIHKGCLLTSSGRMTLAIRREAGSSIGRFEVLSADELLSNPLSPVQIGLT